MLLKIYGPNFIYNLFKYIYFYTTLFVEDTVRTFEEYLFTIRGDSPERRAKIYHSIVIRGKLLLVVCWTT